MIFSAFHACAKSFTHTVRVWYASAKPEPARGGHMELKLRLQTPSVRYRSLQRSIQHAAWPAVADLLLAASTEPNVITLCSTLGSHWLNAPHTRIRRPDKRLSITALAFLHPALGSLVLVPTSTWSCDMR